MNTKIIIGGMSFPNGIALIDSNFKSVLSYFDEDREIKTVKLSEPTNRRLSNYEMLLRQIKITIKAQYFFIKKDMNLAEKIITICFTIFLISLFTIMPYFVSELTYDKANISIVNELTYNIIKTVAKLFFVILYFYLVAKLSSRMFSNHSAEHKLINCVENNKNVTFENVKKQSHFNPRCGTTFLLLDAIIGVIFFGICDGIIKTYNPDYFMFLRILIHLALLPIFLFILILLHKFYVKLISSKKFLSFFISFQKLTLKEADDKSIKLALITFEKLKY